MAEEALEANELFGENLANNDYLHLDRPSTPPPLLKESTPLRTMHEEEQELTGSAGTTNGESIGGGAKFEDEICQIPIPIMSNMERDMLTCNLPLTCFRNYIFSSTTARIFFQGKRVNPYSRHTMKPSSANPCISRQPNFVFSASRLIPRSTNMPREILT
jgi:hypothetical protein